MLNWRRLAWLVPSFVLLALSLPLLAPTLFVSSEEIAELERFFNTNVSAHSNDLYNGGTVADHTNNWAVLVSASKFWFNYRHMANTLGMYRTVKRLGIPDSHILLMLADDAACNPRNRFPANVWPSAARAIDLYGDNVEVDFRGYEVTVEGLIRLLTGRQHAATPSSKQLRSDSRSNVLFYLTGHGGDEFLKFQDQEEISAYDIADAIEQMWQKKRYRELLFIVDTCQANTMYSKIYSPNVVAVGSSKKDQNSYSHHVDGDLGVAMIDRFTHQILEYMEGVNKSSELTLQNLIDSFDPAVIHSDPGVRTDLYSSPLNTTKITSFFGGVAQVDLTRTINLKSEL